MADDTFERASLTLINSIASMAHSSMHRHMFAGATGMPLSSHDVRLVELLSGLPPVPVSQIAEALAIDLAQASRQVGRLTETGYLQRSVDAGDRRRVLVTLTPETARRMDEWLLLWSAVHRSPLEDWPADDLMDFAQAIALQVDRLADSLPVQPVLSVDARWDELVGLGLPPGARAAGRGLVALVTWVGQSQGFTNVLAHLDSPMRQSTFLTLRHIVAQGPLAVSEVATAMVIDPSQASKRISSLRKLGLLERSTSPVDRRQALVFASPAGVAFEQRVLDTQLALFASILPPLSTSTRRRWTSLMQRYVAELGFLIERSR